MFPEALVCASKRSPGFTPETVFKNPCYTSSRRRGFDERSFAAKKDMHDKAVTDRFIQLRSDDHSFDRIVTELNVSKPTLIAWSRKFQFEIQNLRVIQREALERKWLQDTTTRVDALGEKLRKVETELAKRDVAELSTARLFTLADSLRQQIQKEVGPLKFCTPISEIPNDEYREQVQEWTP